MKRLRLLLVASCAAVVSACGAGTAAQELASATPSPSGTATQESFDSCRAAADWHTRPGIELIDARTRTAGEVSAWHETRDGGAGTTRSRWREVDGDAVMTVCLYDGDFSDLPVSRPADAPPPQYERLIVVVDPAGTPVLDRVGRRDGVNLGDL